MPAAEDGAAPTPPDPTADRPADSAATPAADPTTGATPSDTPATGTSRTTVARTMIASIVRAALPPLVAVVTLPIVLGRVSLSDYGLWATITGLIGVLATIDAGLATDVSRKVAAARGADDNAGVVQAGRHGLMVAVLMGAVIMPMAALLGWPIIQLVAPPSDFNTGIALWLGVIVYQSVGWYYAILASVVTGLQRGDVANAVNAMGALVGAGVTVATVLLGWQVYGLLAGMFALGIATTLGHMRATRRFTGTTAIWRPQRLPRAVARAIAVSAVALASMQASLLIEPAVAKALLSALDGPEAAAAMQLGFTVTRLALIAAMAPTAAILVGVSEWREHQSDRILGLVRHASLASLALVGVLAAVMLASGPYLAEAWLGIEVPGIGVAIRGLSVVAVTTIVVWLFTQTLLGHGNTRAVTVRLVIGSAVALAGMAIGAPTAGLAGVIAASLVGACTAALLLSRIDGEYSGVIWRATARMAPAMVGLGVVGAVLTDRWGPTGRWASAAGAVAAGTMAVGLAWTLLPSGTRGLVLRTVRGKKGGVRSARREPA